MTRERIEDFREIILPFLRNVLLKTNYENLGKSDAEEFTRDFNEILDLAIKALEQTRWIPVSERLPEDNTLVLVTVKVRNREPKVRSGYYYMEGHFHIDNGDSWESRDKELLAWMPLPKPYE